MILANGAQDRTPLPTVSQSLLILPAQLQAGPSRNQGGEAHHGGAEMGFQGTVNKAPGSMLAGSSPRRSIVQVMHMNRAIRT